VRHVVQTLVDPAGLGGLRVLVQARGVDPAGLRCLQAPAA
jgi:hypothetical protein